MAKTTEKAPKLRKRQVLGVEAEYWRAPFRVLEHRPGVSHWVAVTNDAQGRGPIYRLTTKKADLPRVTPEMIVEKVRLELVCGVGRVEVTEVTDGWPTLTAVFDIDSGWGVRQRVCVYTSDPGRCPLTPIPSRKGLEAGFAEALARRRVDVLWAMIRDEKRFAPPIMT